MRTSVLNSLFRSTCSATALETTPVNRRFGHRRLPGAAACRLCAISLLTLILALSQGSARAGLLAYEGFEYDPGTDIVGANGGSGWAEPYQLNGSGGGSISTVHGGSLTYNDGLGNSLITTGNRGFFAGNTTGNQTAQPSRFLTFGRSNATTVTWISFIGVRQGTVTNTIPDNPYTRGANLAFFNGTSERIAIGNASGASTNAWSILPANTASQLRQTTIPFSLLSFIVIRIDHIGDSTVGDNAYIFVNPSLASEPDINTANTNVIGFADHSFNRIRPFAGGFDAGNSRPNAELYLDEIRIGETYADVTPHNTGVTTKTVTWEGNFSTDWDAITANWRTNGVSGAVYSEGDLARFDDSANPGFFNVNLASALFPGSVTVSNETSAYSFGGSGALGGNGSLTKQGASSLTIANSGNNSFTGAVSIVNGTLQIGDGGTTGNLGPGNISNAGSLIFNRFDDVTVGNAISGSGSLTKNGDGALTLTASSPYSGQTTVNAGTLVLNGQITGGGTLTSAAGTTVSGSGTHTGAFVAGGHVAPGTSLGTLTVGALTLQTGATATYEINTNNTVGAGINDLIQANGNVTLNNNVITLAFAGKPQSGVPYSLISYMGTRSGTLNSTVAFAAGSRFSAAVGYDDAGKRINVTLSGSGASLNWNSVGPVEWDNGVSSNWFNTGTASVDAFLPFDNVSFGDTPGLQTLIDIPLDVTVSPSGILVNSDNNFYFIGGFGSIGGTANLIKSGTSTLNVANANSFSGGLNLSNGVVRLGTATSAGTGPINIRAAGTLVAGGASANAITLSGGRFGASAANVGSFAGDLTASPGTTSTIYNSDPENLALNAEMIFTGNLQGSGNINVSSGGNNTAVDSGVGFRLRGTGASTFSGIITLSNNVKGELQTSVTIPFSPAGTGKIVLSCGLYDGNDTTAAPADGGFSELNIRNNSTSHAFLGNNLELTGTGWANLNPLGSAPGGSISTMGNLRIGAGQELGVIRNSGQAHVVEFQTVTLTVGNATFSPKTPGFGATGATGSDLSLGNINQLATSGIIMNGLRTLYLTGTNGFTGNTTVSNGVLSLIGVSSLSNSPVISIATGASLSVTGRVGGTLELVGGQTLKGGGAVLGNVTAGAGSTVSPGDSIGTLAISANITLQGTNIMEIDKAGNTRDMLQAIGNLTYGGTLVISNLNNPLAAGDSFALFSAAVRSGTFAAIVPPTPGPGLVWNTNGLTVDGTLKVATPGGPQISGAAVSSGNFVFSGTGGTPGGSYSVLVSTNVALPVASWTLLSSGNPFDGSGNFNFSTPYSPSAPRQFYLLRVP